ncbi:helix-turn-helix transcriptional regulator [Pullulanibacillus sp. KACC 23026]|uniref:helix-turn-helix transcriptional regulator n=1 Tax=Pullulanibacillus sp. KACC 23026 TaxID=3028315 RepID=UPI0023B1FB46|nr:helix-turn-helix transcriptional regulator [Pullulanibacillus sp. KACC 23026]WEG12534.1 helix-turn-helix transcriptional regulator [Pullulanibacillus sp. KACC 23026]
MIGQRIRFHRKRQGLTLEQLSEGICSVSYLSKIEHGDKSSDEISRLLCERLNIEHEEMSHTEQIDQIHQEINHWYSQMITIPNPIELNPIKESLEEKIALIQDPCLSMKYELMCFYYYLALQQYDSSSQLKKKLHIFEEMFDVELQYYYNLFSGIYFSNITHLDEASECLSKAEELQNRLPHSDQNEAELCYQIGRMECLRYQISKCIQYSSKSLSLFNQSYNLKRIADCQILLGISHRRINNFAQSEHHFEQALKFTSILKSDQRTSILYDNMAYCYAGQNNHTLAIDYLTKSIEIKRKNKELAFSVTSTLTLLAEEYFRIGEFNKARETVDETMELIIPSDQSIDYLKLVVLDYQLSDPIHPDYESFLRQKVIPVLAERNMWEEVSLYSEQLAEYYFKKHRYKLSSVYFKKANEARKNIL